ncbi:unnamed protein product, partial [marine sediment metagenome]
IYQDMKKGRDLKMGTLQDVLEKLEEMDIDASEIKISRAASDYIIQKARDIIDSEEAEEGEEE